MRKISKYALAVVRASQLLVVCERNTVKYLLPGGRPEKGESVEESLVRELAEELGANVKLDSLRYYGTFEDIAANEPDAIVEVSVFLGEIDGNLMPSSEIERFAWIGHQHTQKLAPSIENKILPALVRDGIVL